YCARLLVSTCNQCETRDLRRARSTVQLRSLSADLLGAMLLLPSAPGGLNSGNCFCGCCARPKRQGSMQRITRRVVRSGEQLVQARGADGLDQVSLDPRLTREFAAGVLTANRQCNQSQGLQLRMLREMPGDVVTAHVRQIEVHEQNRGHELDGESKSRRAGVRDARIAVPRRLQQGRESIGGIHVVIDYQYARHTASCAAFAELPGLCQRMRGHDSLLNESSRDAGAGCALRSS